MQIAASMLGADPSKLALEMQAAITAGVDRLHWDCMDGHFVPNLAFHADAVRACRLLTTLPFDVHLMLQKPTNLLPAFLQSGAETITIHPESSDDWPQALQTIRNRGIYAGVALKPATPLDAIKGYLDMIDLVLIMTVEPGFGGQRFMSEQLSKVAELRQLMGANFPIHVDGGINPETASLARAAGASVLVSGTAIFRSSQMVNTVAALRGNACQ